MTPPSLRKAAHGPRLVAVSNRVVHPRSAARGGGLAVALLDALRERGGLWFGWSGQISDHPDTRPAVAESGPIRLATMDLSQAEHDAYYNGFANRCLWPLFHLRLDLTAFDPQHYDGYMRVNRRLAGALWPLLRDEDQVWVHDYHLLPFAEALREQRAKQQIGFFLHIPFPVPEMLTALPHYRDLMRSLFSYDLLGFQTEDDVLRFRECAVREFGAQLRGDTITAFGRRLTAKAFPIGIDAREFAQIAESPAAQQEFQRVRANREDRTVIVGVDRLDYTKGIPERFRSVECLLDRYPDTHGQVELLQIAPTSRGEVPEYMAIRRELEQIAGNINGRYAQLDWEPIRYINRALGRRQLAGIYRASRIGLVTPLRDGMNLVAKEYVAAQDPADPGVLVLSRFAGAAGQMQSALIVNPYDNIAVADALQTARYMPLEERRNRHEELMRGLLRDDADAWREAFLEELQRCSAQREEPASATATAQAA